MNPFIITQRIIWEFLLHKKQFTFDELEKEIRKNNGSMSIEPEYPVYKYLEFLETTGDLLKRGSVYYRLGKYSGEAK